MFNKPKPTPWVGFSSLPAPERWFNVKLASPRRNRRK